MIICLTLDCNKFLQKIKLASLCEQVPLWNRNRPEVKYVKQVNSIAWFSWENLTVLRHDPKLSTLLDIVEEWWNGLADSKDYYTKNVTWFVFLVNEAFSFLMNPTHTDRLNSLKTFLSIFTEDSWICAAHCCVYI